MKKLIGYVFFCSSLVFMLNGCRPIDGLEPMIPQKEEAGAEIIQMKEEDLTIVEEEPNDQAIDQAEVIEEQVSEEDQALFIRITADTLNVRADATIASEILGKVHENQIYPIEEKLKSDDGTLWYKITNPEGVKGFVSSEYCLGGTTYQELMIEEE